MKEYTTKFVKYITEDIWRIQKFELSKPHVLIVSTLRILYLAVKGFIYDKCQQKASALTFYSLLSVVPVVALIFGIAKGFGLGDALEIELSKKLVGHEEVLSYVLSMAKSYIENTKGGMIIGVGLLLLFWSLMQVLGNIEQSFNEIWEVKRSRSFTRKFTDYIALVVVAFLFIVSSSSMIVFVTDKFNNYAALTFMGRVLSMTLPYFLICIVFVLIILIIPNTKVNFTSAMVGGVVAGILFQILQYYYIHFQVGVSRYNAIYGSFAALPLFLIWLQASWLIVMFGAELSFAAQNVNSFEFETDTKNVSLEYKRVVALLISYNAIKRFERGDLAATPLQLSMDLKLPIRLVNEIIYDLVKSKVLIEVSDSRAEPAYQPAMDIGKLRVVNVLDMIEKSGSEDLHFEETDELNKVRETVEQFRCLMEKSDKNILLKDI
jgi:membrane protein